MKPGMTKKSIAPGPFVVPMPVVLVGALVDGKPNFMPAAFVGIANMKPAVIGCGLNPAHQTCQGIEREKVFSLNLPSADQVEITDYCGIHSGKEVDKASLFTTFTGAATAAPMIESCKLTAECRLIHSVPYAVDTLYLGEIVAVHVDEEALVNGKPDWKKIAPLLFTFPDSGYWKLGDPLARAWSVGKNFKR
jgi:flavin reductase (DIM6/NTAB) family NADH-FMN oxidoreductase RutF